jgi:hypothetical protein
VQAGEKSVNILEAGPGRGRDCPLLGTAEGPARRLQIRHADSSLSLREAMGVVNNPSSYNTLSTAEQQQINGTLGTSDTIVFAAGLAGGTITLPCSSSQAEVCSCRV